MRLLIQRVKEASVIVDGRMVAAIGEGLLVLVGFGARDADNGSWERMQTILAKLPVLRLFPDGDKHMNRSLAEHGGGILLVSQFTLHADCRKGRRPSFHLACPPQEAKLLYDRVCAEVAALLPGKTHSGIFAADMDVALTNWGPVTILLDSDDL